MNHSTSAATMVTARPKNRLCSRWILATTTIIATVTAFQPPLQPRQTRLRRPSSQRWTVTDPDILLRERIPRLSIDMAALEKLYTSSSDLEEPLFEDGEETVLPKRNKKKLKRPAKKSRSSTMPGFASRTKRQKAFEDGIKLAEQESGKKYVETPEAKTKRRKKSSEQMYKTSASVPDSLVRFANEIHQEDRITPKEEKELGHKTQEAIRILKLKDKLEEKLYREPTDEEWCAAAGKINMEAVSQALDEGLEAKNRLVTSNLRMVQGVVNIYIRNGLAGHYNAGDMMQEGIMALIRAAEKFEPQRGFRFSTYAMYWIRSAVKRSQIFQSRIIPVPQRLFENHKRLRRVDRELTETLGRKPTRKELGEAVGMSETQVQRCLTAMDQKCYSLDASVTNKLKPNNGDGDNNSMYDLVESRSDDGDYKKVQRIFIREDLIETLNRHLKPSEVDLLLLRYGLTDDQAAQKPNGKMLTIAEISQLVGLKPDKVRRIIKNSWKELQFLIGDEWEDFEREL